MKLRHLLLVVLCPVLIGLAAWGQTGLPIHAAAARPLFDDPILGDTVPIPSCVTIDVDEDSLGFTTCAQAALRRISVAVLRNSPSTTRTNLAQAFANLGGCSSSKTAMMIGHGDSGYIHVGGGDYFVDDDSKYVGDIQGYGNGVQPWNLPLWMDLSSSIKGNFNTIFLLGCETGAGSAGAAIVAKFAALTDAHVKAPTSKVWCDDTLTLRLEQGAKWTESGKDEHAAPTKIRSYKQLSEKIRFAVNEQGIYDDFDLDSAKIVSRCVYHTPHNPVSKECKVVTNQKRLLQSILLDQPLQPHAVPNAEITGTIIITACSSINELDKPCQTRVLDVLNDDLVADAPKRTYYHVTDEFKSNWKDF